MSQPNKMSMAPEGEEFSSPIAGLFTAIIVRAVEDWYALIRERAWEHGGSSVHNPKVSFGELRNFFRSDWCKTLIPPGFGMDNYEMLEFLEEKLEEAKRAGR